MSDLSPFRLRVLQKRIDAVVRAQNAAHLATDRLYELCEKFYGATPSDVDADGILDGVCGYNGMTQGITSAEFHAEMLESIARKRR